ncbi:MAG: isoleucine--tRNA ligase [Mollicutes bacterium]|nr:isoleucine--tRNA ligase [Mollicutes bacterium]
MFKKLSDKKVYETEKDIRTFFETEKIFEKSIKEENETFVFYDGPATANGNPGLHHMIAKFLKDTFGKYQTMKGKKVLRKVGWDTHGLPVEVQVEKELGFSGKDDIEKYGIDKFNQKCRESVWKNVDAFNRLTKEMGQFIDLDNPYITYDNSYIETVWYILKRFFEEKMFYEGQKILPWCPRCGTGLASHEVAQGYENITANTVYVTFKKKDSDEYFLVWTTTPWTLISNVGLCVNPNETYITALSKGNKFILSEKLAPVILGDEYKVLSKCKGKDLEYTEYEQLMPILKPSKKAFIVMCDDFVTTEDGTGIVHIAPAFGEDDNKVCKRYNLAILNPVNEDGTFNEGPWQGENIFDADLKIVDYLKENNKLFKKQKMDHEYPHCWRCHSPLVYYARPSYYLEVTKIKDEIIKANEKVNWFPEYVGTKRFGNWLLNMTDWAISRNRYWGTPLPLWRCDCGHMEMIGSIKELKERSIEKLNDKDIDLHKPFVDNVFIKCPKCSKKMQRTPEVIDCWFDSGSMPFAQYHYPFENKKLWEEQYPADFICEGIDQTRGWFYSLLVIGVFLTGKSPYKNVLVNELLLDKHGQKMHKSKGNSIEPFALLEKYGADAIRWYIPYASPVWIPLKFDEEGLKEVHSKFFNPLKNTYNFFSMYATTDNIDINDCNIDVKEREEIDKWLLSKYNSLLKYVTESYDVYDLNKVVKVITNFVSEDLSNWYIRRNRDRFWGSELNNSKKSVYITTYEVITGLCKMIAPIVPFVSEEIYQKITGNKSVHLAPFPKYDKSLINKDLEDKMDLVRNLISIGRYVREENKIKVRQPLSEVLIDGKNEKLLSSLTTLIKEELNVKEVVFEKDLNKYMDFTIKPEFKVVGKIFGKNIHEYAKKLLELSSSDIEKLQNDSVIQMKIDNTLYDITKDMVDIRYTAKEGFNIGTSLGDFVILNTTLNESLIKEGNAREFVSKVQMLRKENNFDIADRIIIKYNTEGLFKDSIIDNADYIKNETLAVDIIFDDTLSLDYNLNDYNIGISLIKN